MGQSEVLNTRQRAANLARATVSSHLGFILLGSLALMLMFSLLRLALLIYNRELIGDTPASAFVEAFVTGLRFDIRAVILIVAPMIFALASVTAMRWRMFWRLWLTALASLTLFLGVLELDFYREFHQRLNSLVFQYMSEDPKTVMSMIWYGYPVVRYLLAWAVATWLLFMLFRGVDRATRPSAVGAPAAAWYLRLAALLVVVLVAGVAYRGTLRQGPPLRWGDAFTTDSMFANHLGLNGSMTLLKAAEDRRRITAEQRAEVEAGVDSVAALMSAVLWTSPAMTGSYTPHDSERTAFLETLERMDAENGLFTRYYGTFDGRRVVNYCPGSRIARKLLDQAWRITTGTEPPAAAS